MFIRNKHLVFKMNLPVALATSFAITIKVDPVTKVKRLSLTNTDPFS